jgi:hypothetical protein
MTIIEIEDYYGNTLMSFRVEGHIKKEDFDLFQGCEVADVDGDYINGTPDLLVRIQSTVKQLRYGDFENGKRTS